MRFLPRERVDAALRARKQAVAAVLSAAADGYQRADATVLLEMSAGLVGDLRRGRVERVTLDRLVRSAVRLGYEVRLEVVPPSAGPRRGVLGTGVDVPASERAAFPNPGHHPEAEHDAPRSRESQPARRAETHNPPARWDSERPPR